MSVRYKLHSNDNNKYVQAGILFFQRFLIRDVVLFTAPWSPNYICRPYLYNVGPVGEISKRVQLYDTRPNIYHM